jgi:hypothetical protein
MGLAPPDTKLGDVVVTLGGRSVTFVVRDVPDVLQSKVESADLVLEETGSRLSQLLGPCYLQGIMSYELAVVARYRKEWEWEACGMQWVSKPTNYLI